MQHTAIAFLSAVPLSLQANADVHLLPAGQFSGRDGRPQEVGTWKLTDTQGRALAARLNARHARTAFPFDYEHQIELAEKNGQPAPAAGWAQRFEWREGEGLYAIGVQWTERARQMLEAGEYRYLSPVITYLKATGEVVDVSNASLVGLPNLLDLNPVAQERLARLNAFVTHHQENDPMNPILKALLSGLGLAEAATEAEATAALTAMKTKAGQSDTLTAENATLKTKVSTAETEVAALRAKSGTDPDPTRWVGMDKFNALNTEVATLKARDTQREIDALIDQAKGEGKLTPAAEEVWRNVGKTDIAQLRAMVEKTPANPALAGQQQSGGRTPPGGPGAADADPAAIARAANKYIADQAAAGVIVTSAEAVTHVMKEQAK